MTEQSLQPVPVQPDLQIRSLLDDPRLRRALGLEGPAVDRPAPRFDRRRLLDDAMV